MLDVFASVSEIAEDSVRSETTIKSTEKNSPWSKRSSLTPITNTQTNNLSGSTTKSTEESSSSTTKNSATPEIDIVTEARLFSSTKKSTYENSSSTTGSTSTSSRDDLTKTQTQEETIQSRKNSILRSKKAKDFMGSYKTKKNKAKTLSESRNKSNKKNSYSTTKSSSTTINNATNKSTEKSGSSTAKTSQNSLIQANNSQTKMLSESTKKSDQISRPWSKRSSSTSNKDAQINQQAQDQTIKSKKKSNSYSKNFKYFIGSSPSPTHNAQTKTQTREVNNEYKEPLNLKQKLFGKIYQSRASPNEFQAKKRIPVHMQADSSYCNLITGVTPTEECSETDVTQTNSGALKTIDQSEKSKTGMNKQLSLVLFFCFFFKNQKIF